MTIVMDVAGIGEFLMRSWYNLGLERFSARSCLITKGIANAFRKSALHSDSGFLGGGKAKNFPVHLQ
jgi:hypothetical protein